MLQIITWPNMVIQILKLIDMAVSCSLVSLPPIFVSCSHFPQKITLKLTVIDVDKRCDYDANPFSLSLSLY